MAEMPRSPDNPDDTEQRPDVAQTDQPDDVASAPDNQVQNPSDPAVAQDDAGPADDDPGGTPDDGPTPSDDDDAVDWSSLDDETAGRASNIVLPEYEQEMTAAQNSADSARIADVQKRYDKERVRLAQEQDG